MKEPFISAMVHYVSPCGVTKGEHLPAVVVRIRPLPGKPLAASKIDMDTPEREILANWKALVTAAETDSQALAALFILGEGIKNLVGTREGAEHLSKCEGLLKQWREQKLPDRL